MGQCLGCRSASAAARPRREAARGPANEAVGERYAGRRASSPPLRQSEETRTQRAAPAVVLGGEESRLGDLFAAMRTGLVCTTSEFSALPGGITTTARVLFSVGSNALRDRELEIERRQAEEEDKGEEGEEEEEQEKEKEEEEGNREEEDKDYVLRVSLYGSPWSRGLHMELTLWPVVGPFARRKLLFSWQSDVLSVEGCCRGELNARALPDSFSSESEFCRCCLLLAYHSDRSGNLHLEEAALPPEVGGAASEVQSLAALAYCRAVANLDAVPARLAVPHKTSQLLYGSQPPVSIAIRVWPSTHAALFGAHTEMTVKAGVIFAEFVYLLQSRFQLSPTHSIKLYHNFQPVSAGELVSSRYSTIDCFITCYQEEEEEASFAGSPVEGPDVTLVVSLVGQELCNMHVNLDMPLREFDALLRQQFNLGSDSFLIVLAEDDCSPQYTTSSRWKCLYPFSLPDVSLGAGLRRSLSRLSTRSSPRAPPARQHSLRHSSRDAWGRSADLVAELTKVARLLSAEGRSFPCDEGGERFGLPLPELYEEMPMYQMGLDRCGLHPYAMIQVFEVTGPAIPVTFRILSGGKGSEPSSGLVRSHSRATRMRQANIMDINPNWTVPTFLQYVDALISPASATRRKRLSLGGRVLEDSEDLSALSIGRLLDFWKPVWWCAGEARPLTGKELDPAHFLLVEKH